MSSSICLPAYILDAHITPRAREVFMLLASQTSAKNPSTWICQAMIAARLRCSVATVARAIQKLIEARLLADTGKLHEGRYKFYHVRWSGDDDVKAASKKITNPIRKVAVVRPSYTPKPTSKPIEGIQLILPPVVALEAPLAHVAPAQAAAPQYAGPSMLTPQTIQKDSRIAYFAEIARRRHEESLRLHKAALLAITQMQS